MRAAALVAALLAGCQFNGGLGEGLLCPTGECPDGQACVAGVCTSGGGPDAATLLDAAADGDAAVTTDAAVGGNLVANPGMENGIDPWTPFNATLAESSEGHSGMQSLLVCNETSGAFTVYQDVIKAPGEEITAGTAYTASAWLRRDGGAEPPVTVKLSIRESGGAAPRADHDGAEVGGVTDAWIQLQASGTIQESDRDNVILIVWAVESPDGACFATDDAVMREE
ncbi:MAG TPA: carbohydrate binding domain-containing protein [Kofleriaceae bacterium]